MSDLIIDGKNLFKNKKLLTTKKQKTTSSGAGLDFIYLHNFSLLVHQPYSHGWFNTIKLSKHFLQINIW